MSAVEELLRGRSACYFGYTNRRLYEAAPIRERLPLLCNLRPIQRSMQALVFASPQRERSTVFPSGNSSASWWVICPTLTCRKIAVRCLVFVRAGDHSLIRDRRVQSEWLISAENASSVPGRRQTAVLRSSTAAKPRVPVPKSLVTNFSPTFAGRLRTPCRL